MFVKFYTYQNAPSKQYEVSKFKPKDKTQRNLRCFTQHTSYK